MDVIIATVTKWTVSEAHFVISATVTKWTVSETYCVIIATVTKWTVSESLLCYHCHCHQMDGVRKPTLLSLSLSPKWRAADVYFVFCDHFFFFRSLLFSPIIMTAITLYLLLSNGRCRNIQPTCSRGGYSDVSRFTVCLFVEWFAKCCIYMQMYKYCFQPIST